MLCVRGARRHSTASLRPRFFGRVGCLLGTLAQHTYMLLLLGGPTHGAEGTGARRRQELQPPHATPADRLVLPRQSVERMVQLGASPAWYNIDSFVVPRGEASAPVNFNHSHQASRRRRVGLVSSSEPQRAALIWLHGVLPAYAEMAGGDSGRSAAIPLPSEVVVERPWAQELLCTWLEWTPAKAWFDVSTSKNYSQLATPYTEGALATSMALVDGLVERLLADGVPERRIVVGGFSMGAALALHYALHSVHRSSLAGALSWSGYPFNYSGVSWGADERKPVLRLMHGTADETVPLEWGRAAAALAADRGVSDIGFTTFGEGLSHIGAVANEHVLRQAGAAVVEILEQGG